MTFAPAQFLFGWLPADARERALRRLLAVWGFALAIGLVLWGIGARSHPLDISLVYSCAISTSIWLFCDPVRIVLHRWLRVSPPNYWASSLRVFAYMLVAATLGYALGTAIGDAYAGRSTWDLVNQSPRRLLGIWVSGMVISGFFVLGFYQRARSEDLQRQATEARLKLLETQLEPHMLFNTLANLRVLIQTDPPRAVAMLDRFNDYLRATLRGSRADTGTHTLADEFARLGDYLELMVVRMGPRLAFGFDLPADLQAHPVPPLLLQPLVENAIRHGLEPKVEGGRIDVTARREGQTLRIAITDTGVGMAPAAQRTDTDTDGGFGLAQVRERLASLPGGAGSVQVSSQPGHGTTVRLTLPLQITP